MKTYMNLLAILAIFMHFAVQVMPLWTPVFGVETIQICTSQGFDSVTIDEYGREVPAPKASEEHCSFCLAAGIDITIPTAPHYTSLIPESDTHKRWISDSTSTSKYQKYAAHLTRGPPALS